MIGPPVLLCPPSTTVQLPAQYTCHGCSIPRSNSITKKTPSLYFFQPAPHRRWRKNVCSRRAFAIVGEVAIATPDLTVSETEEEVVEPKASLATDPSSSSPQKEEPAQPRERRRSNNNSNKALIVSNAELVPGATFPGKVSAIQTFGAFVDMGAFTNGLVHISRLSKSYVKKVEDVVQIGQDVNVQIVDVDLKAKRISLELIEEEKEGGNVLLQGGGEEGEGEKASKRAPRRGRSQQLSKLKIGEILTGSVKNMIRSGVFLSLPDGTDGYLPASEVIFRGANTNLETQFQVGQEVPVRVLKVDKGRVTLTTRQEVNFDKINEDLNKDVAQRATNPFEIAFRGNGSIASLLAEREKKVMESEVANSEDDSSMQKNVLSLGNDIAQVDVEKVDETLVAVVSEDVTDSSLKPKESVVDSIERLDAPKAKVEKEEDNEEENQTETVTDSLKEASEKQDREA